MCYHVIHYLKQQVQIRNQLFQTEIINLNQKIQKNLNSMSKNQQIQQSQFVSLSEVNEVVGSLKGLYTSLKLKGIYLPDFQSNCISSKYLLDIATKKVLTFSTSEIKVGNLLSDCKRSELYYTLLRVADLKKVQLGFNRDHLPNKEWSINVIYTLDSTNLIFKDPQSTLLSQITREELNQLKELDIPKGKQHRHNRMFKSTLEQRQKRELQKIQKKVMNQENNLDELKFQQKGQQDKLFLLKKKMKKIENQIDKASSQNLSSESEGEQIQKQRRI